VWLGFVLENYHIDFCSIGIFKEALEVVLYILKKRRMRREEGNDEF
jgi:hypothetical protein